MTTSRLWLISGKIKKVNVNQLITTHAKINDVAKSDPPKPSWSPTAIARALTVAECEDGIPPDPRSSLISHRLSLYLKISRKHIRFFLRIISHGSPKKLWTGSNDQYLIVFRFQTA